MPKLAEEKALKLKHYYKTKVLPGSKSDYLTDGKSITCSRDSARIIRLVFPDETHVEHFGILFLNQSNAPIAYSIIARGGLTGCVADIRVILSKALQVMATSIIVFHNHPSGRNKPSSADISLTKKLKEACDIMDISLLDHIILPTGVNNEMPFRYFSFADECMM